METLSPPASPMALVIAGAVTLVVAMVVHLSTLEKGNTKGARARKIHTPASTLPLLGNLVAMIRNTHRFHDWLAEESIAANGEPWRLHLLIQPDQIMLSSADAIEEVLVSQFDAFPKDSGQIEILETMFGRGLLASYGERWRRQRKTAAKFFSANVLHSFLNHSVHKSVNRMTCVLTNAGTEEKSVDLKEMFHNFTHDTFVEIALGVDLNCVGSEKRHSFHASLDAVSPLTSLRFRRPAWYWKLERWLGVGREGEMTRTMNTIYEWLNGVVQKSMDASISRATLKKSLRDWQDTAAKTVVELFLEHSRDDADGLEKQDLVDFVLTFVVAARDTTADTLCWFFYVLAQHPDVERKLRAEMASTLADVEHGAYLTTDHTHRLVYLEACIKETLRLQPAVPYIYRQAAQDAVLCGDIFIKKGENVAMSTYSMGRLPSLWGHDAAEFKPERWIDQDAGKIKQVPATRFLSFSTGPRACIGMSLALMGLRVTLANLLRRFHFDVDFAANAGEYDVSPTFAMKNPLMATPSAARSRSSLERSASHA